MGRSEEGVLCRLYSLGHRMGGSHGRAVNLLHKNIDSNCPIKRFDAHEIGDVASQRFGPVL